MAKWFFPLVVLSLLSLVGCATQSTQSTIVANMPPPNFGGPVMQEGGVADGGASVASAPQALPSEGTAPDAPRSVSPGAPAKSHGGVPADWTPLARANSWQYIVIHHSATPTGGAAAFDKMHKAKGWDELGYHFVIGNGTDTRDGQIEVGSRWPKQKWGAHTKTPDNRYNEHGIGICLVGNFDVSHPTDAQLKSVARLVSFLMKTYKIPASGVVGHRDCKSTDCPGKYVNINKVRQLSMQMLADAGEAIPPEVRPVQLAGGEMLHEAKP